MLPRFEMRVGAWSLLMPIEVFYAVDRLEGEVAVLIADSGESTTVPVRELPTGIGERMVLRVPKDREGRPDWRSARIDEAETKRRKREAQEALKELRKRDPGGDIKL